ncbi:MAG: Ferric siderophore transport system, periplasmic binding protein TonB [uncultured Cytophagales bacterium]|uniref:Ferric siderophore transport system, periplasmic binding protein TonB n=1 Tax=uncultured Cytophagales bacterium TaxID=158755 RepID=A0A6J4JD40_9SPHI|nr:MAG: Ferric siderophore transport system, periplasmic binding protein TonB [uncultured Cytophagales bacterium]
MKKLLLSLLAGLFVVLSGHAQDQASAVVVSPEEDVVFQVVEEMPQFPGGTPAMLKYLAGTLRYPAAARDANVQGTVFVGFVVTRTGSISDVTVLKGIGYGCNEEAMRVVQLMPAWIPGRQSGKPVSVRFTLPLRFTLN